jgi:hypothetical protein
VTVSASGSYTYDDNNNLLTTKSLSVYRVAQAYLTIREAWTFTYDNKNRLQSYTNAGAAGDVGNIWYDGRGRVWQRWIYNSGTEEWDSNVTRYVYDGSAYAQEHMFVAGEVEGAWVYTYDQILTDYLRKPGGVRQRDISTVDQSETDQFLLSDSGSVSARIQRETNSLVQRVELSASGTCQASGSQQDTTISKLGFRGGYTETFSGSTEFDPLVQMGQRHSLPGLGGKAGGSSGGTRIGGGLTFGGTSSLSKLPPIGGLIYKEESDEHWYDPIFLNPEDYNSWVSGGMCPACCENCVTSNAVPPLNTFATDQGWCALCCGTRLEFQGCPNCTKVIDGTTVMYYLSECRGECCLTKSPSLSKSNDQVWNLIFDEFGSSVMDWIKQIDPSITTIEEAVNKIIELIKKLGGVELARCIEDCLPCISWYQFITCLGACLLDFKLPGWTDVVTIILSLMNQVNYNPDMCTKLIGIFTNYNPGLVYGCCWNHWAGLSGNPIAQQRFIGSFRCCLHCHADDELAWDWSPGDPNPVHGW